MTDSRQPNQPGQPNHGHPNHGQPHPVHPAHAGQPAQQPLRAAQGPHVQQMPHAAHAPHTPTGPGAARPGGIAPPPLQPGLRPQPVQPIAPHHNTPGLHPPHQISPGVPRLTPAGPAPVLPQQPRPVIPQQQPQQAQQQEDPIALIEDDDDLAEPLVDAPAVSKIKAFGAEFKQKQHQWKRTPHTTGQGAIRMKSFHGKYSDQGLEYLDDAINEWLDNHPEVEVKFVTSTVSVFEGKTREPALVLNLWY
jgi:hypothetical protein